mmetsp:Transcript_40233/g.46162  ORF Transcript_40233/g.46162 Transcript_40233/m.46162 type:complete len:143 (-) Transcript_40233:59-487(-)
MDSLNIISSNIKISKLSTMSNSEGQSALISKNTQLESQKRMTIKSPPLGKFGKGRNMSSLSKYQSTNRQSRLGESRLNSQASRIEDRISRLNNPKQTDKNKGGMFFFESQNENKIIDVKIDVVSNNKKQQSKMIKIDQNKLE